VYRTSSCIEPLDAALQPPVPELMLRWRGLKDLCQAPSLMSGSKVNTSCSHNCECMWRLVLNIQTLHCVKCGCPLWSWC